MLKSVYFCDRTLKGRPATLTPTVKTQRPAKTKKIIHIHPFKWLGSNINETT
jgi:hypothetical protein